MDMATIRLHLTDENYFPLRFFYHRNKENPKFSSETDYIYQYVFAEDPEKEKILSELTSLCETIVPVSSSEEIHDIISLLKRLSPNVSHVFTLDYAIKHVELASTNISKYFRGPKPKATKYRIEKAIKLKERWILDPEGQEPFRKKMESVLLGKNMNYGVVRNFLNPQSEYAIVNLVRCYADLQAEVDGFRYTSDFYVRRSQFFKKAFFDLSYYAKIFG